MSYVDHIINNCDKGEQKAKTAAKIVTETKTCHFHCMHFHFVSHWPRQQLSHPQCEARLLKNYYIIFRRCEKLRPPNVEWFGAFGGSVCISLASVAVEESITVIITVRWLRRRHRWQPHAIMYSQFAFSMPHCV